jgi:hypothetical protein
MILLSEGGPDKSEAAGIGLIRGVKEEPDQQTLIQKPAVKGLGYCAGSRV